MESQEVAQMISKMIVLIVIIQPYQNEGLKIYGTLLDMLSIGFIKDSNLQKREIRIHTTGNVYQALITTRDRGGLWKVNEFVGTTIFECEKNISIFYILIPTSVKMFRFVSKNVIP